VRSLLVQTMAFHRNRIPTDKHGRVAGHTRSASDAKQRRKEQEKVERLQAK